MKLSIILIVSLLTFSMQSTYAKLNMLPTMDILEEVSIAGEREKITTFLNKEEVKSEMIKNGVSHDEAIKRVASLSNSEVRDLSNQISKAQAGGDIGVGGVLGAIVLIFLILLVTDILGLTKVYPFTR